MKLKDLEKWTNDTFVEESRPHINTVRRWARDGELPTVRLGQKTYIDLDKVKEICQWEYEPKSSIDMDALRAKLWSLK